MMHLKIEYIDNIILIQFEVSELDADISEVVAKEIETHIKPSAKIILDMANLEFIDSSGLGTILGIKRKIHSLNGHFIICEMTHPVRQIMELVRLNKVFDIVQTRDEALQKLQM